MKRNIVARLILVVGMISLLVGCGSNKKDSEVDNMGATAPNGKSSITQKRAGGTETGDGETVMEGGISK